MSMTRTAKLKHLNELEKLWGKDRSIVLYECVEEGWTIKQLQTYGDLCIEGDFLSHCWSRTYWTESKIKTIGTWMNYKDHHDPHVKIKKYSSEVPALIPLELVDPDAPIVDHRNYCSLRDPDNFPRLSFYGESIEARRWTNISGNHNSDGHRVREILENVKLPEKVAA